MWLPSAEILRDPGALGQSIFLAQLWHELLSPSSPDSFRAKALDLPLLMEELLRTCSYAQQEPKWISHVHLICEEIKSNLHVAGRIGAIHGVVESALDSISNFNKGAQELPRLMEQVRLYQDLHASYLEKLLDSARTLASDARNKKQLTMVMGGLATHVQSRGASEESISKIDDELCRLPPDEIIEQLCGDINRDPREYSCYISISAPRSIASRLFSGLPFREVGSSAFDSNETAKAWYEVRGEGIVVELLVTASSRHKAADLALAQVLNLIHLHALYANNAMVNASPRVLIVDDLRSYVVEVTPSRHFGLEPRRQSESLSRLRYTNLNGRLTGRLANLLESHALAVSASDARSAVFHLWTALETLASGLGSEGIGERVANVVAPIVAWRRVDKIVTYLAISGHELRVHTGATYDLTHMPNSSARHVDRVDILKAVTGIENNPVILGAFAAFTNNPLLIHRLYRAWEECRDPKDLRATLALSKNRIRWQIMRFYRARNLLVHYGEVDNLAMRLLENAQYYLSTCVGRVLHDLTTFSKWDVSTSLEFHRHRFESLLNRLQKTPCEVQMSELLLHAKTDYAADQVWSAI
ncbi:hypothetical protein ACRPM7_08145 [Burkholderia vietnamiensis]|uniref:hypothetical protein n=1 Tax=Burkholderia vietnamiensis TaxID=60552 RepID=UPI001AD97A62|nr:hypothetical protein [Burkholderia vietnamiensis]MDN7413114.1 hypothetical protein [Burkholderia vietnamiensis]QTK86419.1 hypothetical protein J4D21_21790 [Burkholderia vietnamiensis]